MLLHPLPIARLTAFPGLISFDGRSSGLDCDIQAFWQLRQKKLQPAVPIEKVLVPGIKWYSGFFSMVSTATAHGFAYTMLNSFPPIFSRTTHLPRPPCLMTQ